MLRKKKFSKANYKKFIQLFCDSFARTLKMVCRMRLEIIRYTDIGNMSGMLQPNSSGMEQFGQTTIDDFRPSISPVIPDVSVIL